MLRFVCQIVVNKYLLNDHQVSGIHSDHSNGHTQAAPFLVSSADHLPHYSNIHHWMVMSWLVQKSSVAPNCQQDEVWTFLLLTIWLQPTLSICFHIVPQYLTQENGCSLHASCPSLCSCCSFYQLLPVHFLTSRSMLPGTGSSTYSQNLISRQISRCIWFLVCLSYNLKTLMKATEPSLEKHTGT